MTRIADDIFSAVQQRDTVMLRAWAVEQAVAALGCGGPVERTNDAVIETTVRRIAGGLLDYVTEPAREVNRKLLDAARAYDGKQDAGALIGLLADALEGKNV